MERNGMPCAGIILGAGIMASIDGIVFHQILQWHHVVMTGSLAHQIQSDGLFHAFSLVLISLGVWRFWQGCSLGKVASGRLMWAQLLIGAGAFEIIEGLINHELLGIHHVRYGPNLLAWDLMYLAFGVVLLLAGMRLRRSEAL